MNVDVGARTVECATCYMQASAEKAKTLGRTVKAGMPTLQITWQDGVYVRLSAAVVMKNSH